MLFEISDLKTYYKTLGGFVKAVDDCSLGLSEKEALGLAGESGCGKSTLALSTMKLLAPQGMIIGGKVFLRGDEILGKSDSEFRKIRWKEISMVFQSAMNSLNPVFRIKDQIGEAILTHEKVEKTEVIDRTKKALEMVQIDESWLNSYPHELSGGMKQRVVISMALVGNPKVIIADEPTTALDVVVQAQILKLLRALQEKMGLSMLLITHDLSVIAETCDKCAIMYAGKIVEYADVPTLFGDPKHPYSKGMIESFPSLLRSRYERLKFIPGVPPDLIDPPSGCRFHPRCPYAMDVCSKKEPESLEIRKGHRVACHLFT